MNPSKFPQFILQQVQLNANSDNSNFVFGPPSPPVTVNWNCYNDRAVFKASYKYYPALKHNFDADNTLGWLQLFWCIMFKYSCMDYYGRDVICWRRTVTQLVVLVMSIDWQRRACTLVGLLVKRGVACVLLFLTQLPRQRIRIVSSYRLTNAIKAIQN